jgi:DNA-binding NarL/FixJ family response regulator
MEQLFITPGGTLRERWREAFPDAGLLADLAALDRSTGAECRVVWLDISTGVKSIDPLSSVEAAVALACPVVVLSATPNEGEAFRLLNAGVVGYCHAEAAPEQLREIALVVQHGGLWMPPELVQRFLALSTRVIPAPATSEPELNELTARELLVAEQVARGASNREIAGVLAVSERTVKAHLSSIFKKLELRDRVQLALAMNNIPVYATIN